MPTEHYEYLVMPSVLTNPALLFDMCNKHVLIYLDDILNCSQNEMDHVHYVKVVLQRLCGVCGWSGEHPDGPSQGLHLNCLSTSETQNWLQRAFSFTNFYCCFIQRYSMVAAPFIIILSSKMPSYLSPAVTFQALKPWLIICMPEPDRQVLVEVDIANVGVVLT